MSGKTKLPHSRGAGLMLGCDPEFFVVDKDGKVVTSQRVLVDNKEEVVLNGGKIIRDGVQLELNPIPSFCRELGRHGIARTLRSIEGKLDSNQWRISNDVTVVFSPEELEQLPDEAKKFGCTPSFNVYGDSPSQPDASTYPYRSAGGHIHIGTHGEKKRLRELLNQPERVIPLLDLIVGNTCVMIDRDKGNIIRRKNYGLAGEYRTPPHGLEYRTLSNFWLRDYVLYSFVMGLVKQTMNILLYSNHTIQVPRFDHVEGQWIQENQVIPDYASQLMALVNVEDVKRAINTNDNELARANFDKIKGLLCDISHYSEDRSSDQETINIRTIAGLEKFFDKPVTRWFPRGISHGWTHNKMSNYYGAERYLRDKARSLIK